ncbi:CHAP domain-containing protein [Staphylococcus kloosii]|jgi:surface antigen|uniref:CHAP domain-containing protein n=1 Tax=Staphylococcus kloosii TaxID=29384 RepID=UPI0018A092B9|nr:CHAP domain-containing protein [Staphylococcus kloosii]MBF7030283.1 CHAP domain-containing protein [Staphylococcus kloosii]
MKKIATATIATAGIATLGMAHHHADAAENNGQGAYNPNDASSYSYSYNIDQQGNYHYKWQGNWSPNQAQQGQQNQQPQQAQQAQVGQQNNQGQQNYSYNYGTNNQTQSYTANNAGGKGASYSTSDKNVKVQTQSAPQSNDGSTAFAGKSSGGGNAYDSGQCTYYVYDKVGGKIGSDWGNASNWANKAAQSGYTVDNTPKSGSILQTSQGAYGHVAYVDSVSSDGSVKVSEMNYGKGPGVVTSRTISASEAGSYNYIK